MADCEAAIVGAMTIRNFFRYRVWPWSVINELRGALGRSEERIETLEKAIQKWKKTKDETELVAIADGMWSELRYRMMEYMSEPSAFLARLKNIKLSDDEEQCESSTS